MREDVDELVRAAVAGDVDCWKILQAQALPQIQAIARNHPALRARGLHEHEDDLAELTAASLERLKRDDFHNLRRYLEQRDAGLQRPQSFDSWLYGAVDFVVREHLRKRFGRADRLVADSPQVQLSKRDLHTGAARLDNAEDDDALPRSFVRTLGATAKLTAAEIFVYIDANFSTAEAQAMRLFYAEDKSVDEIAQALQLSDAKAADKLIRKLNARLRYKFVSAG